MAVSSIGGGSIDLNALAKTLAQANSLSYTGSTGTNGTSTDSIDLTGIGADGIGLSAALSGLTKASPAKATTFADKVQALSAALGGTDAAAPAAAGAGTATPSSFETALLKAVDGVNADQNKASNLIQQMVAAPDTVDAHDVTIAMAEANLSLNLARTILDRIVRGWQGVINTR